MPHHPRLMMQLVCVGLLSLGALAASSRGGGAPISNRTAVVKRVPLVRSMLRKGGGKSSHAATQAQNMSAEQPPTAATFKLAKRPTCSCEANNPSWTVSTRTMPKCIFVDVGAGDGFAFDKFVKDGFGPLKDCGYGTGKWEAWLVEANPNSEPNLKAIEGQYPGLVHPWGSVAAYMCDGGESSYLDTSDYSLVTVPTVNLIKLIAENTILGDFVIVNMDMEGQEWDMLPCLAESPVSQKIDRLYIVQQDHIPNMRIRGAQTQLKTMGVDMPTKLHGIPLDVSLRKPGAYYGA